MPTIHDRLEQLIARFSQAEIARRAGTSRANVHRYCRGRRIGAEFCAALVRELGVDPTWLLTGQGTMFSADVSSATARMAGDLLELVEALGAVDRMRLGALSGRPDRMLLRRLNDALLRRQELARTIEEHSRPVLSGLLDDLREALVAGDIDRAEHLRRAAGQLLPLCDDPDLRRVYEGRCGYLEARFGRLETALDHHRRAFAAALARPAGLADDVDVHAYNTANLLDRLGRFGEGRSVCRAALALTDDGRPPDRGRRMLEVKAGSFDLEMGDLRRALARSLPAHGALDPDGRRRTGGTVLSALVLAGTVDSETAAAWPDCYGKAYVLRYQGAWAGHRGLLETARRLLADHADAGLDPAADRRRETELVALADALSARGDPVARMEAATRPEDERSATSHDIWSLEVARTAGATRAARRAIDRAAAALTALPDGALPTIWDRALFHRAVLRVGGPRHDPLRSQAQRFFASHVAAGYASFASEAS